MVLIPTFKAADHALPIHRKEVLKRGLALSAYVASTDVFGGNPIACPADFTLDNHFPRTGVHCPAFIQTGLTNLLSWWEQHSASTSFARDLASERHATPLWSADTANSGETCPLRKQGLGLSDRWGIPSG